MLEHLATWAKIRLGDDKSTIQRRFQELVCQNSRAAKGPISYDNVQQPEKKEANRKRDRKINASGQKKGKTKERGAENYELAVPKQRKIR